MHDYKIEENLMMSIQIVQGGTEDVKGVSKEDYYSLSSDGLTNFGYVKKIGLNNYTLYFWYNGDGSEIKNGKNYFSCTSFLNAMRKLNKCYPGYSLCLRFR